MKLENEECGAAEVIILNRLFSHLSLSGSSTRLLKFNNVPHIPTATHIDRK